MNPIRAVLFDFDGTLTLPGGIDFAGIKKAIRCPPDEPILEFIERLPSAADQRQAWRVLERFEDQAALNSQPNEGTEELIRFLKRRRIRLGILTRNRHVSVETALNNFAHVRLADFNIIITRHHVQRPKPDPEGILLAVRRLRVPAANVLMVGDYRYDIEAGQRAGAPTVFLESRFTTRRPDPPADFLVHRLSEIPDIINRLNRSRSKAHKILTCCSRDR